MILKNHIANRLLNDNESFVSEVIANLMAHQKETDVDKYDGALQMLSNHGNRTYYVTRTVLDMMEHFDTKKAMQADGWQVFKGINCKRTLIIGNDHLNVCIRYLLTDTHVAVTYFDAIRQHGLRTGEHWLNYHFFFVDLENGELSSNFPEETIIRIAPIVYTLMCFVELTENEEIVVQPGAKHGTQKTGKLINTYSEPITIINSRWRKVVIHDGEFPVRGHAAIRYTGPGRTIPRLVYIEPYIKHGYKRTYGEPVANSENN